MSERYREDTRAEAKKILEVAISKHSLNSLDGFTPRKDLLALINYARHIGFNEGWNSAREDLTPEDLEEYNG